MFIIGNIISDGETKFTQHEYNRLQKISVKTNSYSKCKSANMGTSTGQLHGVDLIDIQVQS